MFNLNLTAWGIVIAAVAIILTGTYVKGHSDGSASIQAKWDAAIARDVSNATATRESVDRNIADHPATPDELRTDKWNRDKR